MQQKLNVLAHKIRKFLFDKLAKKNRKNRIMTEALEIKYANKVEAKREKWAQQFKFITIKILYPYYYKKFSKKPIDENKIIFLEIRLPNLTSNFHQIYDQLANNYNFTIHSHFLRNSFVSRENYMRRCVNFVQDLATAKYVFMNEASNIIGSLNIREGTEITQLWHGCGAFKKFGHSTADLIFGDSKKAMEKYPFHKNYTNVTLSSPEVKWAYEEAFDLHEDIYRPIGTSRTDVFYDEKFIKRAKERFKYMMPSSEGKKVILYAPTFRGRVATASTPDMLNIKMFAEALSDEYVLVFKHHPVVKQKPEIPEDYRGKFAMDLSDNMSIDDLLCVADICISDYSSLVFEFSLFEKPMLFFAYDKSDYDDWRGFYYDYSEFCPGPIVTSNREMINYIQNLDTLFDKAKVHAFREKFMSACDGHVTERVLDMVFGQKVLEEHRKKCTRFMELSNVPNSRRNSFNMVARLALYDRMKKAGQSLYNELAKAPVDAKKIAVCNTYGGDALAKKFVSLGYNAKAVDTTVTYEAAVKIIADAKYIISNKDYELLNILKLRPETQLIYMTRDPFMFERYGKQSVEYISGIWRELYERAPIIKNCNKFVSSSEITAKKDAQFYELDPSQIMITGNITTDLLWSDDYKAEVISKLKNAVNPYGKKIMPDGFENKKIIAYLPLNRFDSVFGGANMPSDSYMYEYFHKDYVIIQHFGAGKPNREQLEYYNDSIIDVTSAVNSFEAMAVADIVIGDYRNPSFSYAACRKPLYFFAPENSIYTVGLNSDYDYLETAPGPVFETSKELCEAVDNAEHYDYTKLDLFRNKYLTMCDGKSVERLIAELYKNNK